jgi:diguanylate cyclase (GGDEF)-like protein
MLQNLDAHSLALAAALGALVLAVSMAGIFLAGTRERAVMDWALAGLFFSIGQIITFLTLAPTVGMVSPGWLALINATIFVGHGLVLLGVQAHVGQTRSTAVVTLIGLAILISVGFWPLMQDSWAFRISTLSLFYVVVCVLAARLLWSNAPEKLKPYRRAVAGVILAYAAFLLLRLGMVLAPELAQGTAVRDGLMVPVLIAALLFYLFLSVSLSLMLFRKKEINLQYLARHDPLTGLLNRYSLEQFASREMARAQRGGAPFALVSFDMDLFKTVNDTYGHAAGDQLLKEVADRTCAVIRDADIAFRMGGEEFLVMLPDADGETACQVADRLRDALTSRPISFHEMEIPVSASFGIAVLDPLKDDWESLLQRADRALYLAKDRGRNRVEVEAP